MAKQKPKVTELKKKGEKKMIDYNGKDYPVFKSVTTGRCTLHYFRDDNGVVVSHAEIQSPHGETTVVEYDE